MLKEGHKHLSGLEEAVLKNVEACKSLAQITRTSMGPNGARLRLSVSPCSPRLCSRHPDRFCTAQQHPRKCLLLGRCLQA